MTYEQFIEALIAQGYKVNEKFDNVIFENDNKQIYVREYFTGYYISYEKDLKNVSYELNQNNVTDFEVALKNIEKFEGKIK